MGGANTKYGEDFFFPRQFFPTPADTAVHASRGGHMFSVTSVEWCARARRWQGQEKAAVKAPKLL